MSRRIDAENFPPIGLNSDPQPRLVAAYLKPRFIDGYAIHTANVEVFCELAEALYPEPYGVVAALHHMLQSLRHAAEAQPRII